MSFSADFSQSGGTAVATEPFISGARRIVRSQLSTDGGYNNTDTRTLFAKFVDTIHWTYLGLATEVIESSHIRLMCWGGHGDPMFGASAFMLATTVNPPNELGQTLTVVATAAGGDFPAGSEFNVLVGGIFDSVDCVGLHLWAGCKVPATDSEIAGGAAWHLVGDAGTGQTLYTQGASLSTTLAATHAGLVYPLPITGFSLMGLDLMLCCVVE